jgi:hypothetical protein
MADTHRSHVKLASQSRCRQRARPEADALWPSQLLVSIAFVVEFFSTPLTRAPRLVFLSITDLVNTLANALHVPGDGALRAGLCSPRHRP